MNKVELSGQEIRWSKKTEAKYKYEIIIPQPHQLASNVLSFKISNKKSFFFKVDQYIIIKIK